jgi:hypothetical protein
MCGRLGVEQRFVGMVQLMMATNYGATDDE